MLNKLISHVMVAVLTVVIGMGYAPEGSTGIQAKILGETAAMADARAQVGGKRVKLLRKSYFIEPSGRIRWLVECETLY